MKPLCVWCKQNEVEDDLDELCVRCDSLLEAMAAEDVSVGMLGRWSDAA